MLIYDGETFIDDVRQIQSKDLRTFALSWIAPESPKREELEEQVREWAPDVARAIARSPAFESSWGENPAKKEFINRYFQEDPAQSEVPRLTLP